MIAILDVISDLNTYLTGLFNFLIKVETTDHKTPDATAYDDGKGNLTIGVGFNLRDSNVKSAVYAELRLVRNDPALSPALQQVENAYIDALDIAIGNKDAVAFNNTLAAGDLTESALADWIRERTRSHKQRASFLRYFANMRRVRHLPNRCLASLQSQA